MSHSLFGLSSRGFFGGTFSRAAHSSSQRLAAHASSRRLASPRAQRAGSRAMEYQRLVQAQKLVSQHRETQKLASQAQTQAKAPWLHDTFYEEIRKPVDEAMTLPPEHYTSDAILAHERATVLQHEWCFVANRSEVAAHGDMMPVTVGDQALILANHKGTVRAFHNVCRHRGAKLVAEKCKKNVILCPYHRWGYALDGRLMATPFWDDSKSALVDGKGRGTQVPDEIKAKFESASYEFDKKQWGLLPAELGEWGGMLFANLRRGGPEISLREHIGDLAHLLAEYPLGELVVARSAEVRAKANWKALIENFLEYYHLPAVHPQLCAVSGVSEHVRTQGRGKYMSFATSPLSKGGTAVDADVAAPFPGLGPESAETAHHLCIFPNVFMSIYPHHVIRIETRPVGPGLTVERCTLHVHPNLYRDDPDAEAKMDAWLKWHIRVNDEDMTIVEAVQEGLHSAPYRGGRFSFRFEETLHRFQNMVVDSLLK